MIETESTAGGITNSKDDPQLYHYIPTTAPANVVINVGNSDLLVAAPADVNDPQRVEVGDRRRGDYYLTLVDIMPGLMPLQKVDVGRLAQVDKIRRIRTGEEEQDWVKKARIKSAQEGAEQPPSPYVNPHSDMTDLQRAARGI